MTYRLSIIVFALLGVCFHDSDTLLGQTAAQTPGQNAAQQPRFRASVEVTSVDVAVVDNQGKPLVDLQPADFTVRVDGKSRRVITAEWVSLATAAKEKDKPIARLPEGYSSNENSGGGRLMVLAVDEPNIRPGGALAVLAAASAFIDRLSSSDRIAAVSLGIGSAATPFTADRELVKRAIGRMAGQRLQMTLGSNVMAVAEAVEIANGDRITLDRVVSRECAGLRPGSVALQQCRQELESEAVRMAEQAKREGDATIIALRELLNGLKAIDGPKTLIFMSEGFSVADTGLLTELGTLAGAARTSIYALRLDNQLFDLSNARQSVDVAALGSLRIEALAALTDAARGALFTINGTGSELFAHIESELSGYYLLGVESDVSDRDGKPHPIKVDVSRRGATVRARRQILNAPADLKRPRTLREAVQAGLETPLPLSALPLRVATFSLRGPESSKVQLLIRAEVGVDYTASRPVSLGYVITDRSGKSVDNRSVNLALAPVMAGVPGSLQYAGGASLDPGEYTLKLAVAEGDRVGSVEHPIHATLVDLGEVKLSELMVGGPTDVGELLRPTVGYTVSYGSVHGYLEAYGPHLTQVAAKYEIAATPDGPALIGADVPNRAVGAERALFTHVMTTGRLPPGEYVLRAKITSSGEPLKTLARRFEIAPPSVLMTSAAGVSTPSSTANADVFLPVEEDALVRRFARDEALRPQTVEPFLQRVPPSTKDAFQQGLAELQKANYAAAEGSFKRAIQPDVDSASALAYLAACFAAAGRDAEAASAWQTALVDGSDLPQIYQWLGESLLRARDYTGARSILEEAVGRWPSDTRFARALALMYATLGKGREAVRALDRYIADGHPEPDLLVLVVEWIFQVHNNRGLVTSAPQDLQVARNYAAEYVKADGPKQALVKQWLDFLENEKR